MKKRVLSMAMMLCLLLTLLPRSATAEEVTSGSCGTDVTWNFDKTTGTLTVSGTGAMADYPYSAIEEALHPWVYFEEDIESIVIEDGVTYIGDHAFNDSINLTNVSIADSVTGIGESVFKDCTSLKNVMIPDSVTNIDSTMFEGCTSLTSVSLPANLSEIPIRMFNACSALTDVVIPKGVTVIGSHAFEGCESLSDVVIPDGVVSIKETAFAGCRSLVSITIPASVTYLAFGAFSDCVRLVKIAFEGDAPQITSSAFCGVIANAFYPIGNATWTNDVLQDYSGTIIWTGVENPSLEEVDPYSGACGQNTSWKFADGVLTISGSGAMEYIPWKAYKSEIETVIIEEGVTNIFHEAFYACVNLTSITIPDSVTSIGAISFVGCEKLTSVSIPDGVTEIGERAFEKCTGLSNVVLPAELGYVASRTFFYCTGLTTVSMPKGVKSIEEGAFAGCSNLTSVTIPEMVTVIKDSAFSNCTSLKTIYFEGNGPELNGNFLFHKVSAKAYYPVNDPTWTQEVLWQYTGGDIRWVPYCPDHIYIAVTTEANCIQDGVTTYTCPSCRDSYTDGFVYATGQHTYTDDADTECDICGSIRDLDLPTTPMYRLYNPNSGEHFYTGSLAERNNLIAAGWVYEGIAWNAPTNSGKPVYRLYNPNAGDHHYTMSGEERDMLVSVGWQYEGVCWNSASADNLPLYRLYNPNADCGSHHYTGSEEERDMLVGYGWIYEGIGWFGMLR